METFTQPKITGYRQLNEREAELMNVIKEEGNRLWAICEEVKSYLQAEHRVKLAAAQGDPESDEAAVELQRFTAAEPHRWSQIGVTHLQEGLMALVRAVAQPTSF